MKVITYFSIIQYVVQPNSFEQVPSILLLHSEERRVHLTRRILLLLPLPLSPFACTSVFHIRCTWYRVLIIINTKAIIIDSQNWMLHCLIIIGFRLILQWCLSVCVLLKGYKTVFNSYRTDDNKRAKGIWYTIRQCAKKKRWML